MDSVAATFAVRAGLELEDVVRLGELGLIPPIDSLDEGDIPLARLVIALEKSGISLGQLAAVVSDGTLSLENIDRAFVRSTRMQQGTFSSVAAGLGMSDGFADDIRVALGVSDGGRAGMIRDDDAAVMQLLAQMVDLGVGEDIVTDLFHVMADSLRKMARASSEMWAAGVQQPLLDSGMSFRDIAAAPSLNGEQLQAIGVEVVSTVWSRFLDDEIFSGTVAILERALEEAGVTRVASSGPPAIAFMDLTAFTTFTDREGDAVAAAGARDLRGILRRGIVTAGGTLVKMMGDGAMLHFEDAGAAVACALELAEAIPAAGLPQSRFGIAAGPVIVRDVDFFGHTVNVAARLVDYARPSEVLVTADLVTATDASSVEFAEIGTVSLKGVTDLVHVYSASTS